MKILVAEDNVISMEIVKSVIESVTEAKAEVLTATNGRELVQLFSQSEVGEVQVIITDVIMPEMDGLTAAASIRVLDRPDAKTVPIVALSAFFADAEVEKAKAIGMTDFINKPVDRERMAEVIRKYVHA